MTLQMAPLSHRLALGSLAALTALVGAVAPAVAQGDPTVRVVGGSTAKHNPGVIYLQASDYMCAGSRIGENWILTAKHCTDGKIMQKPHTAHFDDLIILGGPTAKVTEIVNAPQGDMALVKVTGAPKSPILPWSAAKPPLNVEVDIFGWGATENAGYNRELKTAKMTTTSFTPNPFYPGGEDVTLRGVTGMSGAGDSGGPLIVKGAVYGSLSGGTDFSAKPYGSTTFGLTSQNAQWITKTTGIAPVSQP